MNAPFTPRPDLAAIETFLRDHIGNAVHLVAIDPVRPDTDAGKISGAYFGDRHEDAAKWAARLNRDGYGIYFTVNVTTAGLDKKPSKKDIVAARFAHCDIDPPKEGGKLDREALFDQLRRLELKPSLIIDSGNGLQPLWRIDRAVSDSKAIEGVNQSLRHRLSGGDSCHNIDRLLRLPGTINYPSATKLARGCVPVMASLAHVGDPQQDIYNPERLATAFPWTEQPKDDAAAPEAALGEIKFLTPADLGISEINPIWALIKYPTGSDKSVNGIRAAGAMLEHGFSREQIIGILLNPENAVSAHYLAKGKRHGLRAALRAYNWVRDGHKQSVADDGAAMPFDQGEDAGEDAQSAEASGGDRKAKLKQDAADALAKMNAQYFVVREKSHVLVGFFEKWNGRESVVTMAFHEFKNLWGHRHLTIDADPKSPGLEEKRVSLPKWWLDQPRRRQYDGLTLDPAAKDADGSITTVVDGRLNIWRGFGVEPVKGDCSLFMDHLRFVAGGDAERFRYILFWLAWTVQNPARRAEVALVFRGEKGCGKGSIGNTMKILFGCHGLQISSADQISGRFNAHLRGLMLLFADEAYWPGDKAAEGNFKRLISEPELAIEEKGRDVIGWPNMLHMVMASNEEWVVPATEGERRYFVVDVPGDHARKPEYFDPLYEQLENGGYEALLHNLLTLDIGDFHPRKIPADKNALLSQQAASLQPLDAWWVEILETGQIPGSPDGFEGRAVSGDYEDEAAFSTKTRPGLLTSIRKSVPKAAWLTDHAIGKFLRDQGCKPIRIKRHRGWEFPPLEECREKWVERFPPWKWREPIEGWG
jgi:hypothetical protein